MIIFLYGQDTFRLSNKLKEIINYYKNLHKNSLNLDFFDLKKDNFENFKNILETKSIFKGKKLLILENSSENPDFQKKFLKIKDRVLNSKDILIFVERKEISKNNFFNFLLLNGKSQNFPILENWNLEKWLDEYLEKNKIDIDDLAKKILIENNGSDLWALTNEIKKLQNYKNNEQIREEDVKTLAIQKLDLNIFKTIEMIAKNKKRESLKLIKEHLTEGTNPMFLFSMIAFQFRKILMIKNLIENKKNIWQIERIIKLPRQTLSKNILLAKNFSFLKLKKIYKNLVLKDIKIKTGLLDPETALYLFISEI